MEEIAHVSVKIKCNKRIYPHSERMKWSKEAVQLDGMTDPETSNVRPKRMNEVLFR